MKVMVELPESLLEHPQDAGREIVQELALSAFARGRISRHALREQLGLDRWSLDALLAERGLTPSFTLAEAEADVATLTRMLS